MPTNLFGRKLREVLFRKQLHFLFFFLGFFLLLSCSKDKPEDEAPKLIEPTYEYLFQTSLEQSLSASSIRFIAGLAVEDAEQYNYQDLDVYRLTYKTQGPDGGAIEASGAVLIPVDTESQKLISYQHGTISNQEDAPSHGISLGLNELSAMAIFASTGFIVTMPDYIGYGASSALPHPYEHRASLARACNDMLLATLEFLEEKKEIESIYLMGYSEVGYATLSTQQYIESQNEVLLKAVFPAAGAYNKTAFTKAIIQQDEELEFIDSYLWVLDVYNQIYSNLNRPWSAYVKAPYDEMLSSLSVLNRETISTELLETKMLEQNPQKLFKEEFINGIVDGTDSAFLEVLTDNDLLDWIPKAPVYMYHGTEDDYVLPLNTISTVDNLKASGGMISYIPIEKKDHFSAAFDYFLGVLLSV